MNKYNTELLEKGLCELNIEFTENRREQFLTYYESLIEKNKVMNLTAITEFNDVMLKHFLDSLSIVKILDMSRVGTVIDVGTGGGFPGLPLKISFPHLRMTLLDSLGKRVNFLRDMVQELGMSDVKVIHGRAEDVSHEKGQREQYDLCLSRAVANLSCLSEYCLPFVKKNGYFIAYKAEDVREETKASEKAVRILGGSIESAEVLTLPCSDIKRTFIKMKKIRQTELKYPRKSGIPSRSPLS